MDISAADLQDLSELVVSFVCRHNRCHHEMDLLMERFEVAPETMAMQLNSSGISARAYGFLKFLNKTDEVKCLLDYVVEQDLDPTDFVKQGNYNKILTKYGLTITENQGKCIISPLYGDVFEKEIKQSESFIKNNAPASTLQHLQDAKDNLAKGKFAHVLGDCRKSLESLTTDGKFSEGLDELISKKIILQSTDPRTKKMDNEVLRNIYGFNSTLGSHTSANQPSPDVEQALMGMLITESCLRFLLKKLDAAKKNGIQLSKWV